MQCMGCGHMGALLAHVARKIRSIALALADVCFGVLCGLECSQVPASINQDCGSEVHCDCWGGVYSYLSGGKRALTLGCIVHHQ